MPATRSDSTGVFLQQGGQPFSEALANSMRVWLDTIHRKEWRFRNDPKTPPKRNASPKIDRAEGAALSPRSPSHSPRSPRSSAYREAPKEGAANSTM
jgi:hypothetical protein